MTNNSDVSNWALGSCIRAELVFVLVSAFRRSLALISVRHVHLVSPCTALCIRPVRMLHIRPVGCLQGTCKGTKTGSGYSCATFS